MFVFFFFQEQDNTLYTATIWGNNTNVKNVWCLIRLKKKRIKHLCLCVFVLFEVIFLPCWCDKMFDNCSCWGLTMNRQQIRLWERRGTTFHRSCILSQWGNPALSAKTPKSNQTFPSADWPGRSQGQLDIWFSWNKAQWSGHSGM